MLPLMEDETANLPYNAHIKGAGWNNRRIDQSRMSKCRLTFALKLVH